MESDESDKAQLLTLQQLIAEEQKGCRQGSLMVDNDFLSIARQLTVYDPKVHKVMKLLLLIILNNSKDLTKLPIMVMRQYVETSLYYQDFAITPNDSDVSEEAVIIAPTPLLRRDSNEINAQDTIFNSEAIPRIKTISSKEWCRKDDEESVPHLVILQHGYMGSPSDMKLIRDVLTTLLLDPSITDDNVQVIYRTRIYHIDAVLTLLELDFHTDQL